jgi:hypothetical protein
MSETQMPAEFVEADLKRDLTSLSELLGDMRLLYRQPRRHFADSQKLIDLDQEIRDALRRTPSAALQVEVQGLMARLRALDPH